MNHMLKKLCDEIGAAVGGDEEARLRAAIRALEGEADQANARAFLAALSWISAQDERSILERITAMRELTALPRGPVFIESLRSFCWDAERPPGN